MAAVAARKLRRKQIILHSKKQSIPMSINDFAELTIFLCLICFSIYAKIQGFIDECAFLGFFFFVLGEMQDGRQKWRENNFWKKPPVDPADTLWVKNFIQNAISHCC